MKKNLIAFLCIIFLFIGFASGFYLGGKKLDEKLVTEKADAARDWLDPHGTKDKEDIEAQLNLLKIQYRQELSESRSRWVEYAVVIVLAINLILSFKIFSEQKKNN